MDVVRNVFGSDRVQAKRESQKKENLIFEIVLQNHLNYYSIYQKMFY